MRTPRGLRRRVLASIFVVVSSPLYFVAWWTNFVALGPPWEDESKLVGYYWDHWYVPLVLEHLPKVLAFVLVGIVATMAVVARVREGGRGRWLTAFWLWFLGCSSSLVFTALSLLEARIEPWGEWALGVVVGSALSALLPAIVAVLVSLLWLAVSAVTKS